MKFIRHGDILLRKISDKPKEIEHKKEMTIALGEITGHHHTLFQPHPEVIAGALKYLENDKKFLSVLGDMELRHQEHSTLQISEGTYEITIEREFDPFKDELRKVID